MDAFLSRLKRARFNPKESGPGTKNQAEAAPPWVCAIIGLGNPGESYRNTRHNIGFQLVDHLATTSGGTWKKEKRFNAELSDCLLSGHKILLAKPQTYMNDSGQSFSKLLRYHRWKPESVVVAYDEINLPLGQEKLSDRGGPGGHNGMGSILQHGGNKVVRMRLGIGHKSHPGMDLKDHVLGRFKAEDLQLVQTKMAHWAQALELVVDKGPTQAMNFINRKSN